MKSRIFIALLMMFLVFEGVTVLPFAKAQAKTSQTAQEQKLEPGRKVVLRNPAGDVKVTGWDRDTIQVIGERDSGEPVSIKMGDDPNQPGALFVTPELEGIRHREQINLRVNLPRSASIELTTGGGDVAVIEVQGTVTIRSGGGDMHIAKVGALSAQTGGGDVNVEKVEGAATVKTGGGDVRVESVTGQTSVSSGGGDLNITNSGALDARTGGGDVTAKNINGSANMATSGGDLSAKDIKGDCTVKGIDGDVSIENIEGNVNLSLASGDLSISKVTGNVTVVSISGDWSLSCIKGRIEANNASGTISLQNNSGDVDATTTDGDISFHGPITPNGRYRLKTTAGSVEMAVPSDVAGFTVTLSSYTGEVSTDFPIGTSSLTDKKLNGRFGDGSAQITLDSFNGSVNLRKMAPGSTKDCSKASKPQ